MRLRNASIALVFMALGIALGLSFNSSTIGTSASVHAAAMPLPGPPQALPGLIDPVLIVHQEANGGPVSVYISHDPSVIQAFSHVPDGGCSSNGDTCYIEGSPYLTNSTTTITNMLYTGLNNPAPPAH